MKQGKNWAVVKEYAESIRAGRKIACLELKQAVDRFFKDLENPDYWMDYKDPEFCIGIIEKRCAISRARSWTERRYEERSSFWNHIKSL